MENRYPNLYEVLGLFFCSLLIFTWGMQSQEIIGFDSRFYLFALEMWRHGVSWFPTTYDRAYPDYPAMATVLIYLLAKLVGELNRLVAAIPGAAAAALTVVFTYLIGACHSKRWGAIAVLFLLTTLTFLKSARSLSLDIYPTMIAAACFYLVYSADITNNARRARWVYLLLPLGFAFRGPLGLIIPAGVVCIYYLLDKNITRFLLTGCFALLLLITCGAIHILLAYQTGGEDFVRLMLQMEVMGRINGKHLPAYFYFIDSLTSYALSYPVACLVLLSTGYYYLQHKFLYQQSFLLKLCGWLLVIMIGMSIPSDKKIRYILSMAPAAALIAAYPFAIISQDKLLTQLRAALTKLFFMLPMLLSGACVVAYYYAQTHAIHANIHFLPSFMLLICLTLSAWWVFYSFKYRGRLRELLIMLIATISLIVTYLGWIEPIVIYVDRAHAFVVTMETERLRANAKLAFYLEDPDSLPIKYLINMPNQAQPVFINSEQELMEYHEPAFFVTEALSFEELPAALAQQFELVGKDTLGHASVVVFTNIKSMKGRANG